MSDSNEDGPLEVVLVTPEQPLAPEVDDEVEDDNVTHESKPGGGTGTPSHDPSIPARADDPNLPVIEPNNGSVPEFPDADAENPYLA